MTRHSLLLRALRRATFALALAAAPAQTAAQSAPQGPVVNAVLFYSPTCPHCHEVINQHLPPLRDRYGAQFVVVGVDVTRPGGARLYDAAVEHYGLAPDRLGVPLMVVGDVTLLGSQEIPNRLPGLIEEGLAAGGTAWPALPALREALTAQGIIPDDPGPPPSAAAPDTAADAPADTVTRQAPEGDRSEEGITPLTPGADLGAPTTPAQLFLQDPVGNGIAVVTLLALLGVLALSARAIWGGGTALPAVPVWVVPALAAAGLAIAVYLSVVEITGTRAVCGPVGDCNTVQQSPYARLYGVVPVGVLGAFAYLGIMAAWAVATFGPAGRRWHAALAFWALAFVGTAFSAYLTFLEPFVIGATCAWCVSSALLMGLLLLAATRGVQEGP